MSRAQRDKNAQNFAKEMAKLEKRMNLIAKVMDTLRKKHKGKPFEEEGLECPCCGQPDTLYIAWSGPRAALIRCQTPDCVRIMS
jgi:hypothetical protein